MSSPVDFTNVTSVKSTVQDPILQGEIQLQRGAVPILSWNLNESSVELYMKNGGGYYALVKTPHQEDKVVAQYDIEGCPPALFEDKKRLDFFQQHTYVILSPTSLGSYKIRVLPRCDGGLEPFTIFCICAVIVVAIGGVAHCYGKYKDGEAKKYVADRDKEAAEANAEARKYVSDNELKAAQAAADALRKRKRGGGNGGGSGGGSSGGVAT